MIWRKNHLKVRSKIIEYLNINFFFFWFSHDAFIDHRKVHNPGFPSNISRNVIIPIDIPRSVPGRSINQLGSITGSLER